MHVFKCQKCGNCCRWSGAVKVSEKEIEAIATFLNISIEEFLDKKVELMPDRTGLTLLEKSDGSCEYLTDDNRCAIESVKPIQCRNFPDKWNFPNWQKECNGYYEETN